MYSHNSVFMQVFYRLLVIFISSSLFFCLCGSVLQRGLDNFDNPVPNFFRPNVSSQVCRSQLQAASIPCVQGFPHSGLNELGLLIETKGVAQEHGGTEDGADGIGDAFPCNIRGRAVDGLIEPRGGLECG